MNMGGPAYHVSLLSGRLDPDRYETLLACGDLGPGEASLENLAHRYGAHLVRVPGLSPSIDPRGDTRALRTLVGLVRRVQPHIVHTHTAKAGFLGRLAALAQRPRPVIVHTYHGHVLEGYFTPPVTRVYRTLERACGRFSDCLIGVSQATVDDLVRLGVAQRERFRVIPLGLDLAPFVRAGERERRQFRSEMGIREGDVLLTYVGRLAPIKRVDLLIRALAEARRTNDRIVLAIVGDGAARAQLEGLAAELKIARAVRFAGYRSDMPAVAAGGDIAVLASDNEGTPVSLIEAGAAAKPAVATRVGGTPDVVREDCGQLIGRGDASALASAVTALAGDPSARARMGAAAREHVLSSFSAERLLADIEALYAELQPDQPQVRKP